MGWHFSQYFGRDDSLLRELAKQLGIPVPDLIARYIQLPGPSKYTKIRHMDDDSTPKRMQRGQRYDETFPVQGPGIFIFDVSDWSNDCNIEVAITVDDKLLFFGSSYGLDGHKVDRSNLSNWHNNPDWKDHVRQTDDREIAFALN